MTTTIKTENATMNFVLKLLLLNDVFQRCRMVVCSFSWWNAVPIRQSKNKLGSFSDQISVLYKLSFGERNIFCHAEERR